MVRLGAVVVLLWLAGFAWFALTLPVAVPLAVTTDAVVVLTGGAGRLARGVAALAAGSAQRMFVSGVGEHIGKAALAGSVGAPLKLLNARADLGYAAVDTRSNAVETTAWTVRHGYKSLRLVTSAQHMKRARLELAAQMPPSVVIVEDAVPAEAGADSTAREYSKYLLRLAALSAGAA
jgi:X-X-X-Leu-X-X-Gly heptad repeat protein